jgi:hypothetical protein
MLPISRLSIVNQARIELGRLPVSNINDADDTILLDAKIDILLPVLLQETNWDFAIKYKQDSTPLTTQFTPDYEFTYQLPADYGQMFGWGDFNINFGNLSSSPFLITDGLISTDDNPISYYYIVSNVDVDAISTLFYRTLVLFIASDSALVLTENEDLTKYLNLKYEEARSKAVNRNDMERFIVTDNLHLRWAKLTK